MNRSVSCLIFLSCLMVVSPVFAGTQTLTTYYPAPQGNYKNMTVNDTLSLVSGPDCVGPTANGAVSIVDAAGVFEVCDKNGGPYSLTNSSLWTGNGIFMYPTLFAENVGIGMNTNPLYKLGVKGTGGMTVDFGVNGRIRTGDGGNDGGVYVGPNSSLFMGQDTSNNIGFWNNVSGSGGWDLIVTPAGNTGIGLNNAANNATLDVSGTVSVSQNSLGFGGYMHVSGNNTLASYPSQGAYLNWDVQTTGTGETDFINNEGSGIGGFSFMSSPTQGSTVAEEMFLFGNDPANGTAEGVLVLYNKNYPGSGALAGQDVPPLVVCDAGRLNCKQLALAKSASDGNYYAVYGP